MKGDDKGWRGEGGAEQKWQARHMHAHTSSATEQNTESVMLTNTWDCSWSKADATRAGVSSLDRDASAALHVQHTKQGPKGKAGQASSGREVNGEGRGRGEEWREGEGAPHSTWVIPQYVEVLLLEVF